MDKTTTRSEKRVVNEAETAVVRQCFLLRLSMNSYSICRLMNDEGVQTKTGKKWTGNIMGRMLSNLGYIGESFSGRPRA